MPGDGDEKGHWYRCWVCGSPNNELTEPLDDGATKMHTELSDYQRIATGARQGEPLSAQAYLDNFSTVFVSIACGADGNAKAVPHSYEILRTNGCPVCSTSNWRGDF